MKPLRKRRASQAWCVMSISTSARSSPGRLADDFFNFFTFSDVAVDAEERHELLRETGSPGEDPWLPTRMTLVATPGAARPLADAVAWPATAGARRHDGRAQPGSPGRRVSWPSAATAPRPRLRRPRPRPRPRHGARRCRGNSCREHRPDPSFIRRAPPWPGRWVRAAKGGKAWRDRT